MSFTSFKPPWATIKSSCKTIIFYPCRAGVPPCVVWRKFFFIFSFSGAHDAGYIELTVSWSGTEDVKARPHRKLIGLPSKKEQSGCFLSLTHALHGQSLALALLRTRDMISHTHTQSLKRARSCLLALDSGRLYIICGHAGAAINMRETPGSSRRVGMSWDSFDIGAYWRTYAHIQIYLW